MKVGEVEVNVKVEAKAKECGPATNVSVNDRGQQSTTKSRMDKK
jgi:hypothetical protein